MPGRGAHHQTDHGHLAGEIGQREQIVGHACDPLGLAQPMARAVQQEDQRKPLLERELADAIALGHRRGADGPALHAEVLGGRHGRPSGDPPHARNERVGGHSRAAGQWPDLDERPTIEQPVDALAHVELATGGHQALDSLGAAHGACGSATPLQLLENRLPVAHRYPELILTGGRRSGVCSRPAHPS